MAQTLLFGLDLAAELFLLGGLEGILEVGEFVLEGGPLFLLEHEFILEFPPESLFAIFLFRVELAVQEGSGLIFGGLALVLHQPVLVEAEVVVGNVQLVLAIIFL